MTIKEVLVLEQVSKYVGGFPYDSARACYIEVKLDGTVNNFTHRCDVDLTYLEQANYNAFYKGSRLYVALAGTKFNTLYWVDDLDAFAEAFSLQRHTAHTHSFRWSVKNFKDVAEGETIWVTLKMLCGCVLNEKNLPYFAQQVGKQLGWKVVLSGGVSPSNHFKSEGNIFTIEVIRSSLQRESGKYNVAKKSYC